MFVGDDGGQLLQHSTSSSGGGRGCWSNFLCSNLSMGRTHSPSPHYTHILSNLWLISKVLLVSEVLLLLSFPHQKNASGSLLYHSTKILSQGHQATEGRKLSEIIIHNENSKMKLCTPLDLDAGDHSNQVSPYPY